MKPAIKLIISLLIPLAVGGFTGWFTADEADRVFPQLVKPWFTPPAWVFAPVWTILFILMGIAFFIVWNSHAKLEKRYTGYVYYWIQLALNFMWSVLFFGHQLYGWAFLDACLLFLFVAGNASSFRKISKTAAWLLAPYLIWVAFAVVLTFDIWKLNG